MSTSIETNRTASFVRHPRWRMWVMAVSEAIETHSAMSRRVNYWKARLRTEGEGGQQADYNDVLVDVMNDVATDLNYYTRESGDYRVSMRKVEAKYGIPVKKLDILFYEPGALIQSVADFDIDKSKKSKSDMLLSLLDSVKSQPLRDIKQTLLGEIKNWRPKNPRHRTLFQEIVDRSNSVDEIRSGFLNTKLAFEGMKAAHSLRVLNLQIPWKEVDLIKQVQKLYRLGKASITRTAAGITARLNPLDVKELPNVKFEDPGALISAMKNAKIPVKGASIIRFASTKIADVIIGTDGKKANKIASEIIKNGYPILAMMDSRGRSHLYVGTNGKVTKCACSHTAAKEFGLYDCVEDKPFTDNQLKTGIEFELSRTNDPSIAEELAKDHLIENRDYYKTLKKVNRDRGASRTASKFTKPLQNAWESIKYNLHELTDRVHFEHQFVWEVMLSEAPTVLPDNVAEDWQTLDMEEMSRELEEAFPPGVQYSIKTPPVPVTDKMRTCNVNAAAVSGEGSLDDTVNLFDEPLDSSSEFYHQALDDI